LKNNLCAFLLYEKKAEIFKALSNTARLEILDLLADGEKCVQEIVDTLKKYEQPYISKNLSKLKNAGIIKDRKKGLNVYYSIATQCAADFVQRLNNAL